MTDMTRTQIHDLLDRVLDADPSPWPKFWLTRRTDGGMSIDVKVGSVDIKQEFDAGGEGEAVTRALEATAS